ncbi:hypothetical protein NPIL_4291 [Nephila pilipes]|uniref:Uncharacterized protein n=1 Tax=Nephila pilipes TaxID=299642 RepID=A0A8X6JT29_NEPPI|nr:hypothetical protein NPIL_4291 [Nephila pilipes]
MLEDGTHRKSLVGIADDNFMVHSQEGGRDPPGLHSYLAVLAFLYRFLRVPSGPGRCIQGGEIATYRMFLPYKIRRPVTLTGSFIPCLRWSAEMTFVDRGLGK